MRRAVLALLLAVAPGPDRSHPPVPGPMPPFKLPSIQRASLSNGLPVLLVEAHELPVVTVLVAVKAGAAADPLDRPGLASFTADMLDEGAGGKDSLALDDALSYLGADLSTGASWDFSVVSLHVPVARLEPALSLMADIALRPDFPEGELKRLKRDALTALLEERSEPQAIAARALVKAIFGDTTRYGLPTGGDAKTIMALTAEELRAFHRSAYRPGASAVIVAGDVRLPSVLPLLEKAFGSWPPGGAPAPALPEPPQVAGRRIWLVDKPGAEQSILRAGRVGPDRRTRDYPVLQVMNTLLGGSFTSRLNDNLREQHGWTYGAGSGFDYRRTAGLFLAAADVQTSATAPALAELVKELERIRTTATRDEVERARSFLAARYVEEFETTRQIAEKVATLFVQSLPADAYETFVPRALSVGPKDVLEKARAWVDPRNAVIVVVGDRALVEAPLRALRLGEIRLLTVDDVLGPPPPSPPSL